jgi:hypothetical protein
MIKLRMGWACITLGREERCLQDFGVKNLREFTTCKSGRMILKWILKNRMGCCALD